MLEWNMTSTLMLAVGLAFAVGYAFTIIPMLRTMPLKQAAKVTVVGDTASISAMETVEISLANLIHRFMHAGLTDATFWLGLGIIVPAGYAVAYPAINSIGISKAILNSLRGNLDLTQMPPIFQHC